MELALESLTPPTSATLGSRGAPVSATSPPASGGRGFVSAQFERADLALPGGGKGRIDRFPEIEGVTCSFVRYPPGDERDLKLRADGALRLQACPQGGWLLLPRNAATPGYWIPTLPMLRRLDHQGHVLAEKALPLTGLKENGDGWQLDVTLPVDWYLDVVVWRFEPHRLGLLRQLESPSVLERQPVFLWGSKVNCRLPTDLYRYLLNGEFYTDDFVWPRKWKFHSEIDAHGIYVALEGLESATGAAIYGLLKRQVLYSVLLRQSDDGGWYHGEWTDLMESHYRLHNCAMSVLEAGFEEYGDETIRQALSRAADFLAGCTDRTDLGPWFLHDSLERSVEAMEVMRVQTKTPWIPSRTLGKSPTNKLILNTHLDALVVLDRYAVLTGDHRHKPLVRAGCEAAVRLLALKPAEGLYRWLYRAIGLTLLPKAEAAALSAPRRIVKRLTWMYLTPNMHRVKRHFPRLVMPGGLIERHIAPLHHDVNYHPVNVLDLARLCRRFPGLALQAVIDGAVAAVASSSLLEYWAEAANRRFAVVVWADALYHLCLLDPRVELRAELARTLLVALDAGLGLPPALLGGDVEVVERSKRRPCPIADNRQLRVVNLGRGDADELLVVNPTARPLALQWSTSATPALLWTDTAGQSLGAHVPPSVPARGWLQGVAPPRPRGRREHATTSRDM